MLNETLKIVRTFHNLSKAEVADRVGLSRSYITELEAGQKKVNLDVLEKYSAAFSIPVSSLMLFDETRRDGSPLETARLAIGGKVLKMLQWVSDISEEKSAETDRNKATRSH